jgi:uncharacterized Tic20 family protein
MNGIPETPQNAPPGPGEPQGPAPVQPPLQPPGPADKETNPDARMWAMFCHLAGLAGLLPVVPALGSLIGPLVVWLIKKDQYPFVNEQGREAVNFQITMLIFFLVSGLLTLICIGLPLLIAVGITDVVLLIIAAIKANNGEHYRYPYPLIIRFIK